jgi:hypothetical protein
MKMARTVRSAFPFGATPAQYLEHHTIPVTECGCWIWTGPVSKRTGYGQMALKGKPFMPHRVAWEVANGPIPAGLFVLHRCDIRTCVNPDHLFLGSHKQNMRDMKDKSRAASGERNGSAKLTIDDVKAIRNSELSYARLASIYGVVWATIQNIKSAKTWRFVA